MDGEEGMDGMDGDARMVRVGPVRSPGAAQPWLVAALRRHDRARLLRAWMLEGAGSAVDASVDGSCDGFRGFVGFWNGEDWASNFHPAPFEVDWDGDLPGFPDGRMLRMGCSEQWFMFRKAWRFHDSDAMAVLLEPGLGPRDCKVIGRSVRGFDAVVWDRESDWWMLEALVFKFTQDPGLARLLVGTGGWTLVECSPFDRVWGVGLGMRDVNGAPDGRWLDPRQWPGANRLGFRLMDLRDVLSAGGPAYVMPVGRMR